MASSADARLGFRRASWNWADTGGAVGVLGAHLEDRKGKGWRCLCFVFKRGGSVTGFFFDTERHGHWTCHVCCGGGVYCSNQ